MTSHPPRRLLLLCGLALGIGLVAGGTAWVLIRLIAILTNLLLFHRWGTTLPNFADARHRAAGVVLAAMAGAAVVTLLARWAPIIRGHGIPEAMDAVLTRRSRVAPEHRGGQAAVGRRSPSAPADRSAPRARSS